MNKRQFDAITHGALVGLAHVNGVRMMTLVLALSLSAAPACKKNSLADKKPIEVANQSGQTSQDAQAALDKGDLKLLYQPRSTTKAGNIVGSNPQALTQVVANLNDRIALPWDITISFQDCEDPNASYAPDTRLLTICYQLIDEYYDLFATKIKDKPKLDEAVRGAVAATFFHELGHGLVDAWKLPITGKEEDAVDQLSTLVLINNTKEGEQMALDGAISFKLYADLGKNETKVYWDEHSLDEQRFYDTICLIYGHDPEKYSYLVTDGTLPEERAELCRDDYPRVAKAWQQLLDPYIKQRVATTPSPASNLSPR